MKEFFQQFKRSTIFKLYCAKLQCHITFIDFLLIHYFIYRLVRWSDPNVVNLASIVHTLIGTARVSDYLHFFCKVYKYWNLHSGILWSSHKYLSPPIHHLIFLQGSTGFTAFLGNSYIFPFFCSKYPSLIT